MQLASGCDAGDGAACSASSPAVDVPEALTLLLAILDSHPHHLVAAFLRLAARPQPATGPSSTDGQLPGAQVAAWVEAAVAAMAGGTALDAGWSPDTVAFAAHQLRCFSAAQATGFIYAELAAAIIVAADVEAAVAEPLGVSPPAGVCWALRNLRALLAEDPAGTAQRAALLAPQLGLASDDGLLTVPQQAELLLALLPPCMAQPSSPAVASGGDSGAPAAGPSSLLLPWQRAQLLGWLAAMLWAEQAGGQPGKPGQAAGWPARAADQVLSLVGRLGQPCRAARAHPRQQQLPNSSGPLQELRGSSGWGPRAALPPPWRGAVSDADSSSSKGGSSGGGGGNATAPAPCSSDRRTFDIWRRSEQSSSPLSPDRHAAVAHADGSWALAAGPMGVGAPVPAVLADSEVAAAVAAAHAALDRALWLAAQALELGQRQR